MEISRHPNPPRLSAVELEASSLILAVDQGGHASRAIVFDLSGRQLAQASRPIATRRTGTDRVEHDPLEIVATTREAIRDVCETLGDAGVHLKASGLATQRSSIVSWDRGTGAPLSPVLSWQDRRGLPQVEALRDHADFIRERTGLVLSPHYGASKMRWSMDNLSKVQAALAGNRLAMGPLSTYLLYSLLPSRPFVVDPANASRTQLWDVHTADWSEPLCGLFGVPRGVLPRSTRSRSTFVLLNTRTPLTVCTGDQAAALFAHGKLRMGTAYLNIGTGAFLQCVLPETSREIAPLLQSIAWWGVADDSRLTVMEGTINGAGSAIDWVDDRLSLDAHAVTRTLTAAQVQVLHPPIFINGVSGVGSPYWLPRLESRWLDDGIDHGELEQLVAVIESIAFLICANLEAMRSKGADLQQVLASGGLSASDYLCHCIAALGQIEVIRTGQPEMTAAGLAFLTAGEPESWHPPPQITVFKPSLDGFLQKRRAAWAAVMAGAALA